MNLAEMIEGHVDDRVALVSRGREITYGALRDQVARLRGGLTELGVREGDRVAVLCGNNDLFVTSYLAVVGIGAIVVPLNPASPGPELQDELAVVTPCAAIVGPAAHHQWEGVDRAALPSLQHVIMAEREPVEGTVALADLLVAEPVPIVSVDPDHIAAMIFTSGTAGRSKAAMLSHGNLAANVDQGASAPDRTRAGDVVYGVLPLFHIFGLNVVLGVSLSVGATVVLVHRFDPLTARREHHRAGRDDHAGRAADVGGVQPLRRAARDHVPDGAPRVLGCVEALAERGRADARTVRAADLRGLRPHRGVAGGDQLGRLRVPSRLGGQDPRRGRGAPGRRRRRRRPVGDAGEVWVRGANVFQGYLDDPDATARVLVDGWLRTGDIGTVDADGFLYLLDRAKDLIIVSGFNVFPAEVEEVLATHPAVAEVGVLGVPHPHHGEAVKAYVVLAEGAEADEEGLIDHCLDYLARYKCPSKVLFVDELPRNAAGKLIRRELEGSILA